MCESRTICIFTTNLCRRRGRRGHRTEVLQRCSCATRLRRLLLIALVSNGFRRVRRLGGSRREQCRLGSAKAASPARCPGKKMYKKLRKHMLDIVIHSKQLTVREFVLHLLLRFSGVNGFCGVTAARTCLPFLPGVTAGTAGGGGKLFSFWPMGCCCCSLRGCCFCCCCCCCCLCSCGCRCCC